jgi:predicted transcriptional regulator
MNHATLVASIVKFFSCNAYPVAEDTLRKNICSNIARLLKEERLRQKLSLNFISAKAGLNRQTVSFIEQEERTPTVDTLLRLTDVLGIPLEDLIRKARKAAVAKK